MGVGNPREPIEDKFTLVTSLGKPLVSFGRGGDCLCLFKRDDLYLLIFDWRIYDNMEDLHWKSIEDVVGMIQRLQARRWTASVQSVHEMAAFIREYIGENQWVLAILESL